MNVPVILYDEQRATDAYTAYAALCQRERVEPSLTENAQWTLLKRIAFANFSAEFAPQIETHQ